MNCRVCGRQFDPLGFQVMVPGLPHGFDRVDCALEASALDQPPARSAEPVPAVVRALPTAVAAVPALASGPVPTARAQSVRPQLLTGANLALLAAGIAATIYLWLRVFGADAGPFSFLAESASKAFGRTSVAATTDLTPETKIRHQPESAVRGGGTPPPTAEPTAPSASNGGTLVSDRSPRKEPRARKNGGPAARPAPPPPEPPSEPSAPRSAPAPTFPVPSSPPKDRVPGPALPGGPNPEQPTLPDGGRP